MRTNLIAVAVIALMAGCGDDAEPPSGEYVATWTCDVVAAEHVTRPPDRADIAATDSGMTIDWWWGEDGEASLHQIDTGTPDGACIDVAAAGSREAFSLCSDGEDVASTRIGFEFTDGTRGACDVSLRALPVVPL